MLWKGEDLREQKSLCASCDRNETPGHNKNINWGEKRKKKTIHGNVGPFGSPVNCRINSLTGNCPLVKTK